MRGVPVVLALVTITSAVGYRSKPSPGERSLFEARNHECKTQGLPVLKWGESLGNLGA